MPPSRYLGLPWREWGDTDVALVSALDTLEALQCPCGCGQYADLAHDPDTDGWWDVDTETVCYAGAAIAEWRDNKGPEQLDKGALVYVRLDPDYVKKR